MYRVLLADDEQIERMALARRLMRRFGDILQISEATNGKEAVQLYEKEHSQIIIMDISMPELNGVEAAEKIRSMDEDCIIVFLTAYDEFSYAKRAIVIRALDYLLKPCDEEELTAVMEEAMRLTDKAVENKKNSSGSGEEKTEAEKEAEKRKEQWPWNPDAEPPKDPETERVNQVAEKIRTYIRENYMNEISMQDAARQYRHRSRHRKPHGPHPHRARRHEGSERGRRNGEPYPRGHGQGACRPDLLSGTSRFLHGKPHAGPAQARRKAHGARRDRGSGKGCRHRP